MCAVLCCAVLYRVNHMRHDELLSKILCVLAALHMSYSFQKLISFSFVSPAHEHTSFSVKWANDIDTHSQRKWETSLFHSLPFCINGFQKNTLKYPKCIANWPKPTKQPASQPYVCERERCVSERWRNVRSETRCATLKSMCMHDTQTRTHTIHTMRVMNRRNVLAASCMCIL